MSREEVPMIEEFPIKGSLRNYRYEKQSMSAILVGEQSVAHDDGLAIQSVCEHVTWNLQSSDQAQWMFGRVQSKVT